MSSSSHKLYVFALVSRRRSITVFLFLSWPIEAFYIALGHVNLIRNYYLYYYYYYYYYYYIDNTNCENNNETDDRHSSLAINIKLKYYYYCYHYVRHLMMNNVI